MAKISIDNLSTIPEKLNNYPEYNMFGEPPVWGVFVRLAHNVQLNGLSISATKADFRTVIVLDDVHQASLKQLAIKV